jgi:hypothetical protein
MAVPRVSVVAERRAQKRATVSAPLCLTVELTTEQLDAIAERVAGLLGDRDRGSAPVERLLTVDELAELLATTTDWVRRHQTKLGAFRLSEGGGRSPIRFRAADVERFLAERRVEPSVKAGRRSWRADPDWALR